MKVIVSHRTALRWYVTHPNPRSAVFACRVTVAGAGVPGAEDVDALKRHLGEGAAQLDVLVSERSSRRKRVGVRCHVCPDGLPASSLVSIPCPIEGIDLYICSAELVFCQIATEMQLLDTVFFGMALCARYRLDETRASGVAQREDMDAPLTSTARIGAYLARMGRIGRKPVKALRALPFVRDGARSPKEAGLAMLFGLPIRHKGMNLGSVKLNVEVGIRDGAAGEGRMRTIARTPDLMINSRDRRGAIRTVAIDYDSDAEHSSPYAQKRDARRRNELEMLDGVAYFAITREQAQDFRYLMMLGERIRLKLRRRREPRALGTAGSPEYERHLADVQHAQFELWLRYVNRSPFEDDSDCWR